MIESKDTALLTLNETGYTLQADDVNIKKKKKKNDDAFQR